MCVLRASGTDFDPDVFLEGSPFDPCKIFRHGEPRLPRSKPSGARYETSGVNISVSDAPWSKLLVQVAEAERFLRTHRPEIERLAGSPGVSDLTLDFPVELRIDGENVIAQFDRFPASLVSLAGGLGIALELSIFPAPDQQK